MKMKINRKDFIGLGMAFAASGCSTWDGGFPAITAVRSPNGLLRHASIGTANMAGGDIKSLRTHPKIEMAAFCDVDAKFLDRMKKEFPKARFYRDWRELLAKEGDAIDSMNISIPDHNHTIVAAAAMRKGKHIYLQKPLCKSHAEAALLRDLAVRNGVVTQMGAQYTAFMADRQTVELLRTGALGPVERVYFFSTRKGLSRRRRYLPASVSAPEHLDWDLWLGTAAARPYAPEVYHPLIWRVWRDLGSGWIGDIGCHLMSAVWKGMALGKAAPLTVVAETQTNAEDNVKDIVWPTATHITWRFAGVPASGGKPFEWEWFDGCSEPDNLAPAQFRPPAEIERLFEQTPAKKRPHEGKAIKCRDGWILQPHAKDAAFVIRTPLAEAARVPLPRWSAFQVSVLVGMQSGERLRYDRPSISHPLRYEDLRNALAAMQSNTRFFGSQASFVPETRSAISPARIVSIIQVVQSKSVEALRPSRQASTNSW